jgi:hypothetical protein
MRPEDIVVFAVVKNAVEMENITKEYTPLLAKVISNLYFQHMRLVLGRSTRRSRLPGATAQPR